MAERASAVERTTTGIRLILALRLLIARAGNKDSLSWWDDESLTPAAAYLLNRLFPMAPRVAGKSLALRAALARHRVACPEDGLHLYRLDADNRDKLALRFARLESVPVPEMAVGSTEALRGRLLELTESPQSYTVLQQTASGGLLIDIPPAPVGVPPMVHRAKTLAWAYLEGAEAAPVFPFYTE